MLLAISLIGVPALGFSQTIFKCTDESGTIIFSESPCAMDAEELHLEDTPSGILAEEIQDHASNYLTNQTFDTASGDQALRPADKGVIALANGKCFVIDTLPGYVLVDGWVNVPEGTEVIGNFNTFGPVKVFDTNGKDVSGFTFIDDWGLSKSSVLEKWADKCGK